MVPTMQINLRMLLASAVTALLLATGEASWTCALATLLVACRPQWLATWSDALYLPRPAASRAGR